LAKRMWEHKVMTSSQRTQAFQFMAVEKKVTDFFTDTGKFW